MYCDGNLVTLIIKDRAKTASGTTIGTINSTYKPSSNIKIPVINDKANAYLLIYNTTGDIYYYDGGYTGTNTIYCEVTYPLNSEF